MNTTGDPLNGGGNRVQACWNQIGVWGSGECPELTTHVHCRNCPVYSEAAGHMLDAREVPLEYLPPMGDISRVSRLDDARTKARSLLFRIGPEWLGSRSALVSGGGAALPWSIHCRTDAASSFSEWSTSGLAPGLHLARPGARGSRVSADLTGGYSPGRLLVMGHGTSPTSGFWWR